MSLLPSDFFQLGPSARVSGMGSSGQHQLAAVVRQRLISGALGYCFLACVGCSFDARPNNAGVHSSASMADAQWMPPSAAAGGRKAVATASAELDGATDAMPSETGSGHTAAVDAGTPRRTSSAMQASAGRGQPRGDRDLDASVSAHDAAKPDPSKARDAQAAPAKPDAASRDAGSNDEPATAARCKAGPYTGTFSGSMQLIGLSLSSVTGVVRAELSLDASGDRLTMHDGVVMGVDQDGNRLTVDLSGSVNCNADKLENAKLENGNFHNLDSNSDTAFTGSAEASYSHDPYSLVGTFSVEATDTSLLTGRGTWTLIRSN